MVSYVGHLLCGIRGVIFLTRTQVKQSVLQQYNDLVGGGSGSNNNSGDASKRFYFIGPKPITLELKNLVDAFDPNTTSITGIGTNAYAVTPKADGEGHLVFVTDKGDIYLINTRGNIVYTGLKSKMISSILHCEFVTTQGSPNVTILLFDAYFINGEGVWATHNLTDRLAFCEKFAKAATSSTSASVSTNPFQVFVKEFDFHNEKNVLTLAKKMLKKSAMLSYKVDGLIFTPVNSYVGQIGPNDKATLGGTWRQVFKWKPPTDNTIDFLIKEIPDLNAEVGKKTLLLQVGCASSVAKKYFNGGKTEYKAMKFVLPGLGFGAAPEVARVQVDSNGIMRCVSTADEILDNYVVEMSYNMATKQWIPNRIRQDKIDEARSGRITANSYETACGVWRSIVNPITEDHISGTTIVTQEMIGYGTGSGGDGDPDGFGLGDGDVYYQGASNKQGARKESEMYAMQEFHNSWVKNRSLIAKVAGGTAIFDLACGKGGDIFKWINNKFTTAIGVDISDDNINNVKNGAYARLSQPRLGPKTKLRYAFLPMSSSEPYKDQLTKISDPFLQNLASCIWGDEKAPPHSPLHPFNGLAKGTHFDVASCQFAFHYFMESKAKFHMFVDNLDSVLKPGGYFIGTCFDGEKVDALLLSKGGLVESKNNISNTLLWSIGKKYDTYKPEFGQKIQVYTDTIHRHHDEYLVPWTFVQEEMKKRGYELPKRELCKQLGLINGVATGTFDSLFDQMKEYAGSSGSGSSGSNDKSIVNALKMSPHEKQFSFLNRWFIFRKNIKIK